MADVPPKAWNNTPDKPRVTELTAPPTGARKGRLSAGTKEKPVRTRCTYEMDIGGEMDVCGVFPSWEVPGKPRERRCELHKGK